MTDASQPWDGVPLHPETRRFHLLRSRLDGGKRAAEWWPAGADAVGQVNGTWFGVRWGEPKHVASDYEYLGPLYTKSEAAALAEAAAVEMRERAKETAASFGDGPFATRRVALAIEALPLPAPSLDAIRAETDRLREAIRRIHRAPVFVDRIPAKGITEELIAAIIEAAELAGPGEATSADQPEPIQAINTLGRITEALGVPWDATASRILEVIGANNAQARREGMVEVARVVSSAAEEIRAALAGKGRAVSEIDDLSAFLAGITPEERRILAGLRDGSLVAVPREPTEAMLDRAGEVIVREFAESDWEDAKDMAEGLAPRPIWDAMLAAAEPPR